jgi:hypothetical protein
LLLLDFPILPVDSNVESSNIASLESSVCYSYLDTGERSNVPEYLNLVNRSVITLSEQCFPCKVRQNRCYLTALLSCPNRCQAAMVGPLNPTGARRKTFTQTTAQFSSLNSNQPKLLRVSQPEGS